MKFKTQYNRHEFPDNYEKNGKPSKTVPDQSMSIKEILDRYARGLPIEGGKVPIYDGEDDDMPDLRTLDLSERAEVIESAQRELLELNEKKAKADRDKISRKIRKEIEEELRKEMEDKDPPKPEN